MSRPATAITKKRKEMKTKSKHNFYVKKNRTGLSQSIIIFQKYLLVSIFFFL